MCLCKLNGIIIESLRVGERIHAHKICVRKHFIRYNKHFRWLDHETMDICEYYTVSICRWWIGFVMKWYEMTMLSDWVRLANEAMERGKMMALWQSMQLTKWNHFRWTQIEFMCINFAIHSSVSHTHSQFASISGTNHITTIIFTLNSFLDST